MFRLIVAWLLVAAGIVCFLVACFSEWAGPNVTQLPLDGTRFVGAGVVLAVTGLIIWVNPSSNFKP